VDESLNEFLFGPLPNKWIQEVDLELREAAISETKKENWTAINDSRIYSDSSRRITEMCETNLSLVDGLRFLQKGEDIKAEVTPFTFFFLYCSFFIYVWQETYLSIYGRIIGRALRTYLEQTYNYFVEEFPPEQRTLLSLLMHLPQKLNHLVYRRSIARCLSPRHVPLHSVWHGETGCQGCHQEEQLFQVLHWRLKEEGHPRQVC